MEVSRAWQALRTSDVRNNRRGATRVWSVNRFPLDVVVMILLSFFSQCLPLQLPFCKTTRADGGQDSERSNEHSLLTPQTLALSALLLTGPSAAVSQFSGNSPGTAAAEGGWQGLLGQLPTTRTHARRREADAVFKTSLGPTLWQSQSPSCPGRGSGALRSQLSLMGFVCDCSGSVLFQDRLPALPRFCPLQILPKFVFRNLPRKFTQNLARTFTRVPESSPEVSPEVSAEIRPWKSYACF